MANNINNEKINTFLDYFNNTGRSSVEVLVDGIGWLILLKENIEIVSDNWFASTKYSASTVKILEPETSSLVCFTNIYQKNLTFTENANNVKYNMLFDEICIFIDKIVAFH